MQASNGSIISTIIVCTILLAGFGYFTQVDIPEPANIPTATEIADLIVIPEAQVIELPDNFLSVRDEKKALALELAEAEIDTRGFDNDVVDALNNYSEGIEVERRDLTSITFKDSDVSLHRETATVTLELKVRFDNFGDEDESEYAIVEVEIEVYDLVRDDDYEDADVDDVSIEIIRTSVD